MKELNILVVDDESPARRKVIKFLEKMQLDSQILEAADASEAWQHYKSQTIDLLFLDIHMPGMSGIEWLEKIENQTLCPIIFTTAYDEYAIRAFDFNAIDYLLKPFDFDRFKSGVQKVLEMRNLEETQKAYSRLLKDLKNPQESNKEVIWVLHRGKYWPIRFKDIEYIESSGNYVTIHVPDRKYMVRNSLQKMLEQLSSLKFVQSHRSYVVNLDKVETVIPKSHGDCMVLLTSGERIPLSRKYRDQLF